MIIARSTRILVLAGLSVLLSSCCTFARLLCGPDDSRWVSEQYETAAQTLATFQESLRRADRPTLLRCLSERYRDHTGLDPLSIEVTWSKLRDAVPGIHLLGTAAIKGPEPTVDGRLAYVLSVAGRDVRVILARCPYWEVRWTDPEDETTPLAEGSYDSTLAKFAVLGIGAEIGTTALDIRLPGIPGHFGLNELVFAGIGVFWKVDDIQSATPEPD